jgi:peptide/nickel transport system substrate-binding protein
MDERHPRPSDQALDRFRLTRRGLLGGVTAGLIGGRLAAPAGAQEGTPAPEPTSGGTLTFAYPQVTSNSNFCAISTIGGSEDIYSRRFVFSDLVQSNQDFTEWLPDLAESYEFAENTLTVHLRPGVIWHDGQPFTADDVEFTLRAAATTDLMRPIGRGIYKYVAGMEAFWNKEADTISGVRVLDELTVAIDMVKPYRTPILAGLDQIPMLPRHVLEAVALKDVCQTPWATQEPVGTGPFRVTNYQVDQFVEYEANPDYHFGRPLLDNVVYRPFADTQTLAAALENKEVDVGTIPATELERFRGMSDFEVRIVPGLLYNGGALNTRQPYLSDKRVRQALMYAIDREAFIQAIYGGTVPPLDTVLPYTRYGVSPNVRKYPYDPELAKQLLTEAGWDPNRKIRWLVTEVTPSSEPIYAAINGYWAEVGVQAEFQVVGAEFGSMIYGEPYDFDTWYSAWGFYVDPSQTRQNWTSDGAENSAGVNNPRLDELYELIEVSEDEEQIRQMVWEIQEIIAEECYFLLICQAHNIWAINRRVHDLNPIYAIWTSNFWNLQKVWVES